MATQDSIANSGHFIIGCNYWASHAGTSMWRDWRPEVVDRDLAELAKGGIKTLRVFPLWPDFQPLHALRNWCGHFKEYSFGQEPLTDDEAGRAGVDSEMIRRFDAFLSLARKHNLSVIVSLINGWMSGKLFVPPALENKNLITDPMAVSWEIRFVRYFVTRFRECNVIQAWEAGNECNCLAPADRNQAYLWSASITNAIRASDSSRPVFSGMHGLLPNPTFNWTIQDQAEVNDVMTVHPYPLFTPYCDQDPINTIRTSLHATAEARMYTDIGGKPVIAEEMGTLGPMFADEQTAGAFLRTNLFSLWANECPGLLWWCGFDQIHLKHPPYDWEAMECELGLLRNDYTPKAFFEEFGKFRRFLESFPVNPLPRRITDAVCVLSDNQDQWATAYSSFVLAKQAGIDIEFQYQNQPLKEAPIYLVPSISGTSPYRKRRWAELLNRVQNGATLYVSINDGFIAEFEAVTGLKVQTRQRRPQPSVIHMDGLDPKMTLTLSGPLKFTFKNIHAQILGRETDSNPAFTCATYGKGKVFLLALPLETETAKIPGIFQNSDQPLWKIYRTVADSVASNRVIRKLTPNVCVTEHPVDSSKRVIVAINHTPEKISFEFTVQPGWKVEKDLHGEKPVHRIDLWACSIPANSAAVFEISR